MALSQQAGATPVKDRLSHRYSIYITSVHDGELNRLYGSHLFFAQDEPTDTATYDYYINKDERIRGNVLSYKLLDDGREYVLQHFFEGKYDAIALINDLPNIDNMKTCVVGYANKEEDKQGTYLMMVLIDQEVNLIPFKK